MPCRTVAIQRARWISVFSAALAFGLGLLGLLGWILNQELLKTGFTGEISIKANAAVLLCCISAALLVLVPTTSPRRAREAARGVGLLGALLGAATLSQHLLGWDLGIDQLLFTEPAGEAATASPGRMGPPASASYILLGLGVFLFEHRTPSGRSVAQWLACAVIPIALLGTLGYATDAAQLYGIARYTGIALPTAVSLLLLATSLFLARTEFEPASILVDERPGGDIARTMFPTAILLPIVTGWALTQGEKMGLYGPQFGRALLLLTLILVFTAIVWRLAIRLSTVEAERSAAELASLQARAEAARLASENLETLGVLESLLMHAPIGLVFFDRAGHCVRVNDFLSRMRDAAASPLTGLRLSALLPGAPPELETAIERAFDQGVSTMNLEFDSDLGAEQHWLAGVFPVQDSPDESRLAGLFLLEISERKRLESQRAALLESERAARMEAERSATLRDQFLATLSHELRTPLNSILGWTTIAKETPGRPSAFDKPLEVIERNARAQARLIEDLLDVSRIVSGKMRLTLEPVSVAAVAHAAIAAVQPSAHAKGIDLDLCIDPDLGPIVADAARLQQVLWNLLSNAVKFTPNGGSVRLDARPSGDEIEFAVSDTGDGVSPEFLSQVFDRFRQADPSTTRRHGGLGLGLSIVKQLVDLHGGSVHVESAGIGFGATFTVRLPPSAAMTRPSGSAAAPEGARPCLAGVHVLVVDDEPDAREFLRRILTEVQASVAMVGSVDDALAALGHRRAHVVVSDIGMPGKDGYELIGEIRKQYDEKTVPAIAVTAFARPQDAAQALAAGFQAHMAKPVEPHALTLAVANLANRSLD